MQGTQSVVVTEEVAAAEGDLPVLRLRQAASTEQAADPKRGRVTWTEDTVEINEFSGKKKSKKCCIFHPSTPYDAYVRCLPPCDASPLRRPHGTGRAQADSDSDSSSSSSSDSETSSDDERAQAVRRGPRPTSQSAAPSRHAMLGGFASTLVDDSTDDSVLVARASEPEPEPEQGPQQRNRGRGGPRVS